MCFELTSASEPSLSRLGLHLAVCSVEDDADFLSLTEEDPLLRLLLVVAPLLLLLLAAAATVVEPDDGGGTSFAVACLASELRVVAATDCQWFGRATNDRSEGVHVRGLKSTLLNARVWDGGVCVGGVFHRRMFFYFNRECGCLQPLKQVLFILSYVTQRPTVPNIAYVENDSLCLLSDKAPPSAAPTLSSDVFQETTNRTCCPRFDERWITTIGPALTSAQGPNPSSFWITVNVD